MFDFLKSYSKFFENIFNSADFFKAIFDYIPFVFWVILAVSLVGSILFGLIKLIL